jgi:hypothetical protein
MKKGKEKSNQKNVKKNEKKVLTNQGRYDILFKRSAG